MFFSKYFFVAHIINLKQGDFLKTQIGHDRNKLSQGV